MELNYVVKIDFVGLRHGFFEKATVECSFPCHDAYGGQDAVREFSIIDIGGFEVFFSKAQSVSGLLKVALNDGRLSDRDWPLSVA